MTKARKPTLTLVPSNPSDFGLAAVILRENTSKLRSISDIQAAFSLYFQWPNHRQCIANINNEWLECCMSYDEDERTVSEIKISTSRPIDKTPISKNVTIRFEVFRACYEFEAEVLASEKFEIIVEPPTELLIYKNRRAPRFNVTENMEDDLKFAYWIPANSSEGIKVNVRELSIYSISVDSTGDMSGPGTIRIRGKTFNGTLIPRAEDRAVVILVFKDGVDSGIYFDIYRLIAHPGLVDRSEMKPEQTVRLYQAYLEQHFPKEKHDHIRADLESTWSAIQPGTHAVTADYVVLDQEGQVTGASSTTLAFFDGIREQWAFHQLCALKIPVNLSLSESLYTWRLDYLASRTGARDMIGWYTSKSRWVERIYTKFHVLKKGDSLLSSVNMAEIETNSLNLPEIDTTTYKVGHTDRVCGQIGGLIFGYGPTRLSISGGLDIIYEKNPGELQNIESDVELIRDFCGKNLQKIYLSTNSPLPNVVETWRAPVDRYFQIRGEDAIDLRASVEHSLAATIAKWERS